MAFEAEGVGAAAAGERIVDRLERSGFVREDLRRAVLRRDHLAGVRPAEQHVVAGAAIHPVGAEAADQKIVAGAAGQLVVARTAPDLVVAGAGVERVVAGHAGDQCRRCLPENKTLPPVVPFR